MNLSSQFQPHQSNFRIFIWILFSFVLLSLISCTTTNPAPTSQRMVAPAPAAMEPSNLTQSEQSKQSLTRAQAINNYIGFLDESQVQRIKNYQILGSNFHSDQSIFNVAFFIPSKTMRHPRHAQEETVNELQRIYKKNLERSNLVLSDTPSVGSDNRYTYDIQGVDCLKTSNFRCQLQISVLRSEIVTSPPFVHREGGSYFVKVRARLHLPQGTINGVVFYQAVTKALPNWTFNLVDYETDKVVHIQRGYQKYYF